MSGVQFQGHLSPCLSLKAYRRCRNSACARYDRCQSFHIVPSKKLPRCQLTARFTTAWTVGSSLLSSEKSEDAGIRQIRHWLDTWWQNPALAENFYPAKTYTISAPCHAFHVHTCMHIYIYIYRHTHPGLRALSYPGLACTALRCASRLSMRKWWSASVMGVLHPASELPFLGMSVGCDYAGWHYSNC